MQKQKGWQEQTPKQEKNNNKRQKLKPKLEEELSFEENGSWVGL